MHHHRASCILLMASVLAVGTIQAAEEPWTIVDLGTKTFVDATDGNDGPIVVTSDWEGDTVPKTCVRRIMMVGHDQSALVERHDGKVTEKIWLPDMKLDNLYTADGSVGRTLIKAYCQNNATIGVTSVAVGGFGLGRGFIVDKGVAQWLPKFQAGMIAEAGIQGLSNSNVEIVCSCNFFIGSWDVIRADRSTWNVPAIWSVLRGQIVCQPLFSTEAVSKQYPNLRITAATGERYIAGTYASSTGNTLPFVASREGVSNKGIVGYTMYQIPLVMGGGSTFTSGELTAAEIVGDAVFSGVVRTGDNPKARQVAIWKLNGNAEFKGTLINMPGVVPRAVVGHSSQGLVVNTEDHRVALSDLQGGVTYMELPGYMHPTALRTLQAGTIVTATKDKATHLLVVWCDRRASTTDAPQTSPSPPTVAKPATFAVGDDKYGHWADLTVKGVTQRMRWIAPGTFTMGSVETQHLVTITTGVWMADSSCTQELWHAVMGTNPSSFTGDLQRPVEQVSNLDIDNFLGTLNSQILYCGFRLPTEAIREYACRAGTQTDFAGPSMDALGWDLENSGKQTHPVKQKSPNAWGLYDMHGNVWEWCWDWLDDYPQGALTDPTGPKIGIFKIIRGGSCLNTASDCQSAFRKWFSPEKNLNVIGFRFLAMKVRSASP